MRVARLVITFALLALAACATGAGPDSPPESDGGQPTDGGDLATVKQVEIGTGSEGFEPIVDGQTMTIIQGPQGGFHIWAAARVRAPIDPKNLKVHFQVFLDGGVQSDNTWQRTLVQNGEAWDIYQLTEVLNDPAVVRGKEVEFRLDVTDAEGRTGSDSRRIIPQGP